MHTVFVIFLIIICLLLVMIVLVQNSKGGGLASNFAGSNQYMGVRKTADFLEKATWGLVAFVVVLSVATVAFHSKKDVATDQSEIREQAQQAKKDEPGVVAPNFGETPEAKAPATPAKK